MIVAAVEVTPEAAAEVMSGLAPNVAGAVVVDGPVAPVELNVNE